jgi:hypothetical protein
MSINIGEIDAVVAPPPAQQPVVAAQSLAQPPAQPDLRRTLELLKERAHRLKAD